MKAKNKSTHGPASARTINARYPSTAYRAGSICGPAQHASLPRRGVPDATGEALGASVSSQAQRGCGVRRWARKAGSNDESCRRFAPRSTRGGRTHGHDHAHAHDHRHGHTHDHDHDHGHTHDHGQAAAAPVHSHGGGRPHSHQPPDQLTTRGLLGMGAAAGLIPCPSALVVLLGAIAQHQIGLGLLLIVVFSLGLAATLTGLGLVVVHSKARLPTGRGGRLAAALPSVSAAVILAVGCVLTLQAIPRLT